MRPYSPGGALIAFASARSPSEAPVPRAHRLRRGLPGYLILFATHAFASQRQNRPSDPLSPPVFRSISTHFTAPPNVPVASACLKGEGLPSSSSVEPRDFTMAPTTPPTRALSPVIPNNACTFRLTAAAGTELAGASFGAGQSFLTPDSSLHPEGLHPARGVAPSGLRPLRNIRCCSHP